MQAANIGKNNKIYINWHINRTQKITAAGNPGANKDQINQTNCTKFRTQFHTDFITRGPSTRNDRSHNEYQIIELWERTWLFDEAILSRLPKDTHLSLHSVFVRYNF